MGKKALRTVTRGSEESLEDFGQRVMDLASQVYPNDSGTQEQFLPYEMPSCTS